MRIKKNRYRIIIWLLNFNIVYRKSAFLFISFIPLEKEVDMAKSKKRGPAQKSKSSYAQELQMKKQLGANIIADWTAQLCLDTMAIVLNDPEVMGHSALGSKRLMRVCEAFNELFDKTRLALSKSDEAEYWRVKIDQAQERIFGPGYLHWQERYSYWDERDTY